MFNGPAGGRRGYLGAVFMQLTPLKMQLTPLKLQLTEKGIDLNWFLGYNVITKRPGHTASEIPTAADGTT